MGPFLLLQASMAAFPPSASLPTLKATALPNPLPPAMTIPPPPSALTIPLPPVLTDPPQPSPTSSNRRSPASSDHPSHGHTPALTIAPSPPPDPAQLAAEVTFLRRRLAEARQVAPPPADTARRLTLGEPCTLELYRPLAEKRRLLAETVALGDGDAVLAVRREGDAGETCGSGWVGGGGAGTIGGEVKWVNGGAMPIMKWRRQGGSLLCSGFKMLLANCMFA